jgi:WD40 repeat protein
VIVALLVFGFCAATLAALRIRRDNQDIRKAKDEATEKLRTSYLAEARANRNSGRAGRRFDSLEAVRKAAAIRADLAVRNEAIACMTVSDLRESKHADLVGHAADDLVCYDLKLERYAIGESNGNIRVHTVADDQVQAVLPAPGWEVSWIQSFSPDSRYLKVIYRQPQPPAVSVWVWDMETQTAVLKELSGEWAANFSSDSRFFAMCHTNGTISIYDLTSGHERNHLPGTRLFRQLILNPGNTRLACANEDDPRVEIREVESGRVVTNLVCPPGVSCVAWTPDGKRLATAGMDFHSYRIYLWEVETGQRLATLEGHENYITSVAFNHAGNLLASAGWDTLIRLWDAGAGSQIASHPGGSLFLGFSPDDRYLLGWQNLARYGSLKVACSQEFRQLHSRRGYGNNSAPEFSADGRILAVRTDQVRFWDVFHGQEIGSMALPLCDAHLFSPDGKSLILIDRTNGTFQCSVERIGAAPSLTIRLGRPRLLTTATAEKDFNIANHAALSLDGRHLAVTHESGSESFVFDLQHPEASPVVLKPHFKADRIAISPDGHWAATASWHDSFVKVWDAASGNPLRTLPMPAKRSSLAFSPDGRWLATSTTEYQLWEVGSWQPRGPPRPGFGIPELNSTAFSPDGRVMARTSGGNRIQLLETATEKPLATLEPPGSITWVGRSSFSPDGTRLAAMQGDQQVQLWDLRLLRQELAEMHLDWDMPPYPPLVQAMASPVTLEIESDPTNSASTK